MSLISTVLAGFRTRVALQTEILALRHQIIVLRRSVSSPPRLRAWDRFLWIWLLRLWPQWWSALLIVRPETVIAWHRKGFRILYVFIILSHERRRVIHFNVTFHPTAQWTSQQLLQAFPYDTVPQYVLRDRDQICGHDVQRQLKDMGIKQVLTAPRSQWRQILNIAPHPCVRKNLWCRRSSALCLILARRRDWTTVTDHGS